MAHLFEAVTFLRDGLCKALGFSERCDLARCEIYLHAFYLHGKHHQPREQDEALSIIRLQGCKVNGTCVHQNWVIALSPFGNIYGFAELHIATGSSDTSIHKA